jgi:DNA-binding CsgD family transcriptional regulator
MAKAREGDVGFPELVTQARITNRLLAVQLRGTMSQQDLVGLLLGTGASNQDIAAILNTTAATVATTAQRLRKKAQAKTVDGAQAKANVDPNEES